MYIYIYIYVTVTGHLTYNGDSSSDSYTETEINDKFFLKVNQSYGEVLGKLRINGGREAPVENTLYVGNPTAHTNYWTPATFHQLIVHSGSWIQLSRDGTSNTWQTGMDSVSSYVIRASDATTCLRVNPNGNSTISGNLDAGTTGNNSIKIHGTGVATSYAVFTTNNGYNSFWGFQNGNHPQAWSNISVKG